MKNFWRMLKKPSAVKPPEDKSVFAGIIRSPLSVLRFFFLLTVSGSLLLAVSAQTVAVLTPEKTAQSAALAAKLETVLAGKVRVLDRSLSENAFDPSIYENPFNLSLKDSQNIGAAVGCQYFLLIKAATLRRFSLEKKDYYESFAAVYGVSSRTGRLFFWKLVSREARAGPVPAEEALLDLAGDLAAEISEAIRATEKKELSEPAPADIEELPDENSPEAENFRPPLPFKRIRPRYTETADLYGIEATVDILLDVDETGKITKTEIGRWAGFGLDEAVSETVLKMNWRPASRNGKTLPMRVLLRYNFR